MRATVVILQAFAMPLGTGCEDDGTSTADAGQDAGHGPELRCRGEVLERRAGGAWIEDRDCEAEGLACGAGDAGVATCVEAPCRTGEKDCDGDTLVVCMDGAWTMEQDCASIGQHCVPLLGGLPQCSSESR